MTAGQNPGIQGLRGIAILLVLLNHAGVPGFGGGYVGVDVFFVISGYLIGGLLLREGLRHGRIAAWDFYARRIRRLFPANAFLLVAVSAASLLLLAPLEWGEVFSAMRAAQLYVINIWFTSRATDYFGGHDGANPLLHLWSLAVEEQFYLVWPWFVVLCLRGSVAGFAKRLWLLTITMASVSLVMCVAVTWQSQPLAFFNMPFRMWEFAAGITLSIRPVLLPNAVSSVAGGLALAGLFVSSAWMDASLQFPGLWAMLPVLCTLGLLQAATQPGGGFPQRVLSWRPLVWLGNCSYSVYLWHWPVLIFSAVVYPQPGAAWTAMLLVLSVALGWASWHWIEEPWRNRWLNHWQPSRFVIFSVLLAVGMALALGTLRKWPLDADQSSIAKQRQEQPSVVSAGCHAPFDVIDLPECVFGTPQGSHLVVLWGDSHAVNWFPAFETLARQRSWRLVSLTKSGCPSLEMPVWNKYLRRQYVECEQWRERMFQRIAAARPDLVVLSNYSTTPAALAPWQNGLDRTLRRLESAGIQAAVIRDTPWSPADVPTCAARARWRGRDTNDVCGFTVPAPGARGGDPEQHVAVLAQHPGVVDIDLSSAFCAGRRCAVADGTQLRFYDDNHLTPAFSRSVSDVLAVQLQSAAIANASVARLFREGGLH